MGSAGSEAEWLSQQQAADLVGVSVKTVEFAARSGKFVKRATAPSLHRDSVLTWARARKERRNKAVVNRRRREPAPPRPPEPQGWLELGEAAEALGLSRYSVLRLAARGVLEKQRSGRQWYVPEHQVTALVRERAAWVSAATAAEIVGCTVHAIETPADEGRIERRDAPRWLPSLRRDTVERFAVEHRAAVEQVTRRRLNAPRPASLPPDDEDVWLSLSTVAKVLGLSTSRVSHLTRQEALPATRRGNRWWFRRGDIERYAAARAARRSGGCTLLVATN